MDDVQNPDPALEGVPHEVDTATFETPASPVDEDNVLVFFGDRNEGQTLPFTHDA